MVRGLRGRIWWRQNVPIFRFAGAFVALLLLFQLAYYEFITGNATFRSYLSVNTHAAAALLGLIGEPVTVSGDVMTSTFSMSIKRGCDGLQAMATLAIGVLTFPAGVRKTVPAIVVGTVLLFLHNITRIVSLFWAGVHPPSHFQDLHAWPAFLVLCACAFWVAWAMWATRAQLAKST